MKLTLTREEFDELTYSVDTDWEDPDFRDDYSGRGMYGDTCFGYVGSNPGPVALELAITFAKKEVEGSSTNASDYGFEDSVAEIREAMSLVGAPRQDSMGLSTIYYWPNIQVEPAMADSEA